MNISAVFDWRSKRAHLNPLSIQSVNYSSYSLPDYSQKKDMGEIFDYYSHPDIKKSTTMTEKPIGKMESSRSEPWLIKSALHVCNVIFRKLAGRANSPEPSYYDCESLTSREASPCPWQSAKTENKIIQAQDSGFAYTEFISDMNGDYQSVVASCEDKLNKVRRLITSKPTETAPKCSPYRTRRRRRVFVEAGSVEELFQEAFLEEDFFSLENSDNLSHLVPCKYQEPELFEIYAPKTKTEMRQPQETEITKLPIEKKDLNANCIDPPKISNLVSTETVKNIQDKDKIEIKTDTNETVASCESKMLQLRALLKEKSKAILNSSDSVSEPVKERPNSNFKSRAIPVTKTKDKRYKNPHRLASGKRKKCNLNLTIKEEMSFADEIDNGSSFDSSPSTMSLDKSVENLGTSTEDEYFDEVAGRFRSASGTESDDSFQVVFTDIPQTPRSRRPSDCDSEDSFIFFEDSPDSCYTSNDVFGDDCESDYSDSDSEVSDSGCGGSDELKMSHSMTKTYEDLTDDSLYVDKPVDEVDCAVKMCEEIPTQNIDVSDVCEREVKSTGLLLDDIKKSQRKKQPPKKVHFSEKPPKVHVMRVWAFAARQARAGHWERHALDRERFKRRIADADMALSWVLKPQHRSRVMFQRFMPWWNAQKRKEIAERKQREEEEKRKKEEEEMKKKEEETRKEEESNKNGEEKDFEPTEGNNVNDESAFDKVSKNDENKVGNEIKNIVVTKEKPIKNNELNTNSKNNITNKLTKSNNTETNDLDKEITDSENKIKDTNSLNIENLNEKFKNMKLILASDDVKHPELIAVDTETEGLVS